MLTHWIRDSGPEVEKVCQRVKGDGFKSQMLSLEADPLRLLFRARATGLRNLQGNQPSVRGLVWGVCSAHLMWASPATHDKPDIYHHALKFFKPVAKHGFSLNKTSKESFIFYISFDSGCFCKPVRNVGRANLLQSCPTPFMPLSCFPVLPPSRGAQAFHPLHDQNQNGECRLPLDLIWQPE